MHAVENASRSPDRGPVAASNPRGNLDTRHAQDLVRSTVLAALGETEDTHGSPGIVAAIHTALLRPDTTGADPAAGVLKKIEDALQQVGKKLADRGLDQVSIDATLARFRSDLANALDASAALLTQPTASPAPSGGSVDRIAASEVVKQKGAIDILTTEGDRVSIRFRTKDALTATVSRSSGANGITTTSAGISLISRGRLQVEVAGDLNNDELTAIGDLLTHVDALATKFFSGDVQAAFTAAAQLGVDSDQIAAFHLNLTYSQTLRTATSFAPTPVTAATPAAQDTATSPATTQRQPAALPSAVPAVQSAGATTTAKDADTPATTPGTGPSAPATTATPAGSALETIGSFIRDVISKLGSVDGAGRLEFSMSWKVSLLVTALSTNAPRASTPAGTSPASTTALLGDALQKAVA
jgi:hypothetical protein